MKPGHQAWLSPNWQGGLGQACPHSGPQFTHPREGWLEGKVCRASPQGIARTGPPQRLQAQRLTEDTGCTPAPPLEAWALLSPTRPSQLASGLLGVLRAGCTERSQQQTTHWVPRRVTPSARCRRAWRTGPAPKATQQQGAGPAWPPGAQPRAGQSWAPAVGQVAARRTETITGPPPRPDSSRAGPEPRLGAAQDPPQPGG